MGVEEEARDSSSFFVRPRGPKLPMLSAEWSFRRSGRLVDRVRWTAVVTVSRCNQRVDKQCRLGDAVGCGLGGRSRVGKARKVCVERRESEDRRMKEVFCALCLVPPYVSGLERMTSYGQFSCPIISPDTG